MKEPAKWRNTVYVLTEICHQRSKWLCPWSHFWRGDHTKCFDLTMDIISIFSSRMENNVFTNDNPIEMFEWKICLDMKNAIMTHLNSICAWSYVDVMVLIVQCWIEGNIFYNLHSSTYVRIQSFTSLKADLRQYINRGFAFSRFLHGTFPWRNCSVKTLIH